MNANVSTNSLTLYSPSRYSQPCSCSVYQATFGDICHERSEQQSGISQLVAASSYLDTISNLPAFGPRQTKSLECPGQTCSNEKVITQSTPVPFSSYPNNEYNLHKSNELVQQTGAIGAPVNNLTAQTSVSVSGHHKRPQRQPNSSGSSRVDKEKCYYCWVCHKGFAQNGNLKTHMMIHTGEKPYSCALCGKCFTQKGNVDTHMKVHTGERSYVCNSCGKNFSQKGNLKTHLQSVHNKVRPFRCGLCDRHFSQKVNLNAHYRTHNRSARLPCTFCRKTFAHKGSLKTHIQSHAIEQYGDSHHLAQAALLQIQQQASFAYCLADQSRSVVREF